MRAGTASMTAHRFARACFCSLVFFNLPDDFVICGMVNDE